MTKKDRFFSEISKGLITAEAARKAGISRAYAYVLMSERRKKLKTGGAPMGAMLAPSGISLQEKSKKPAGATQPEFDVDNELDRLALKLGRQLLASKLKT